MTDRSDRRARPERVELGLKIQGPLTVSDRSACLQTEGTSVDRRDGLISPSPCSNVGQKP